MQAKKRLLRPERLRRVHRPFGWVDTRLIRGDWLAGCSPTAWALYLAASGFCVGSPHM